MRIELLLRLAKTIERTLLAIDDFANGTAFGPNSLDDLREDLGNAITSIIEEFKETKESIELVERIENGA